MTETLTHSKRQLFRACRRAYFYRYEMGLVPRIEKETRRRGTAFGLALHAVAESEDDHVHVIARTLGTYYNEAMPSSQTEQDALEHERDVTAMLAVAYVEHYGLEGRREIEYERPLVNPDTGRASRTFKLGGKIDGMRVIGPQRALLIEDKLTAQINQARMDSLPLDEQTTEYLDALLWKGWEGWVEYRYTRWPSIRQRKDESQAEFIERFSADLHERGDFYFVKQTLDFPTEQLEDHRRDRWQIAKDIIWARRTGRWYKSPQLCDPYSGGCRYLPLCACWPDAMSMYRVEADNPELQAYKEESGVQTSTIEA